MAEAAGKHECFPLGSKETPDGEGDHGLPFTPTGEVTLSQVTWERLDKEGYSLDITHPKDRIHTGLLSFGPASAKHPKDRIRSKMPPVPNHFDGEGRINMGTSPGLPCYHGDITSFGPNEGGFQHQGHKPNLKPQQFDGSKPLREYLQHFKVVASLNSWTDLEKGLYLAASLTGPAQRILNRVDVFALGGYDQLLLALQERYAPRHQEELYRATLKNRRQGKEELLRTLAEEVEIAVEKAYPYADRATVEQLTTEHFLTAVWDRRVRQWVHLRGPRNLRDAVALALQAEAYYKGEDLRTVQRTRMVTTGYGTNPPEWQEYGYEDCGFSGDTEQIAAVSTHRRVPQTVESRETGQGMTEERVLELVKRALEDWKSQPRTDQDKSGIQCYSCREYGHFARECPGIRSSGNRNQEN